jgi:hypothetical protein
MFKSYFISKAFCYRFEKNYVNSALLFCTPLKRFKIICLCEKKKPIVTNDICYLYFYLLLFVDDHFDKYSSSIIELVGTNVTLYFLIS